MDIKENQQETNQQAIIFGNLFLLANRLQIVCDQYLDKDNITTKQWLLLAAISQFTDRSPTLTEVSGLLGYSRQNIKQLALKLEKNGFVEIRKDEHDTRAYRLVLTEKCNLFWKNREDMDNRFIASILSGLTSAETNILSDCISKVMEKIDEFIDSNLAGRESE
ncbi:MarR family winged helix-turn-helix transcriptional regulator [Anaerosacchariphilus polymeriproducens]|uniref:MarR family transcriptional regulator n=1 Tax=Anaerosacchariphilus polymeriproducens TaxID=1812858 RepID=A0A371AX76_9FIRM|nr:MarR family transcriptional regulator [Anaerosacchariphilus polymeriproducens]RDU24167.1 MarR family transcriptional regulator [Anaerosacchariphilus polymeriproducens]